MRVTNPLMVESSSAQVEISLIVVEDLPYAVFLPAVMRCGLAVHSGLYGHLAHELFEHLAELRCQQEPDY